MAERNGFSLLSLRFQLRLQRQQWMIMDSEVHLTTLLFHTLYFEFNDLSKFKSHRVNTVATFFVSRTLRIMTSKLR